MMSENPRLGLPECDWHVSLWVSDPGVMRLSVSGQVTGHEVDRAAVDAYGQALSLAGHPVNVCDPGDGTYSVSTYVSGHLYEVWAVVDRQAFEEGTS